MKDTEKVLYKLGLKDLFPSFAGEKITPDIVGRLTLDEFSCLVIKKRSNFVLNVFATQGNPIPATRERKYLFRII